MADTLLKKDVDAKSLAEELVGPHIPAEENERFFKILRDWNGREADVINVMYYATQQEKTQEYLTRLEEIFSEHLRWVPIADRRNPLHPSVRRTEAAVESLYTNMGLKPNK